jgi:AcrR family transcriptional regulator
MSRGRSSGEPINTPLQKGRKATQRERLLRGMIRAANRDGYAGANVSAVIAEAQVSRPTFYDYFEDRDDCFIAALIDVREAMLGELRDALDAAAPQRALAAAIEATVGFAGSQPARARFLMKEALAGEARALDERDRGIRETARLVEDAFARVPADALIPDFPVAEVLGGIQRLLASRLRRGEAGFDRLRGELERWLDSHARPASAHRWRALTPKPPPDRSTFLLPGALRAPAPLAPGRPRISAEEVAENHRQRIMFATSQVVQELGYHAATVAEIARRAGLDGRVFYGLFADKEEAFSAVHELGFRYLMEVVAGAYFAPSAWPERIWEALRATTQLVDENATFGHVAFVDAYAVGPSAIQRVEDSHAAFKIFLEEGYRASGAASAVTGEAVVATVFELLYRQVRKSREPRTATLLSGIVYLCLAPFIGPEAADEFVAGKLAQAG